MADRPETAPPRLPNRFGWTPDRFRFADHGTYYDYFLVRDAARHSGRRPFGRDLDKVELVTREGKWSLYRKR